LNIIIQEKKYKEGKLKYHLDYEIGNGKNNKKGAIYKDFYRC